MNEWMAIALAMVAATPGVLAYLGQRKRIKIEAGMAQSSGAIKVAREVWKISEEYKERVKTLEEKIKKLEEDIDRFLAGIKLLLKQLEDHDIEPDWSPDK
jgi:cytochrome c556